MALVRVLLFGVGFGDQTFGDVPLRFRVPDYITNFIQILKMIFQKYFYRNIRMCAVINHCHSYEWILNNDDNDIFGETWCAVEGLGMCYCCDCE